MLIVSIVAGAASLAGSIPASWLPSSKTPDIAGRVDRLDWKVRAAVGRENLISLGRELWRSGISAGRVEGSVSTILLVLVLSVMVLVLIVELRTGRGQPPPPFPPGQHWPTSL